MKKTNWRAVISSVVLMAVVAVFPASSSAQLSGFMPGSLVLVEGAEPDAARDLFNSGRDLYDSDKFPDAERKFREVIQKYPKNEMAERSAYYLIRTLAKEGKKKDALDEVATFEKMYPKSVWLKDVREESIELSGDGSLQDLVFRPKVPPAPPAPPSPPPPPDPYRVMIAPKAAQAAQAARAVQIYGGVGGQVAPSDNPEVSLQQEVLRVLFDRDPDHAIDIASDRLKSDPADPVVLSSLFLVANSKSDKALPFLINVAKTSPNMKARRDAIFWISRSKGDKDVEADALIGLMPSMTSEDDSAALVFSLSQLNTQKSTDALVAMARDKNQSEKVRASALQWLANSRATNRLAILEDIYKSSMDDAKIRKQAMQSITMTHDPEIVGFLAGAASNDPDQTVRRQAVSALGQIKSPEALKALEDLLNKKPQQ